MDASLKVSRAVTKLAFDMPFYGSCALTVGTKETTDLPTAATDGKTILYNPEFVDKLTEEDVRFLIAHEVMHIILLHCQEIHNKEVDSQLANISMDYVINTSLTLEAGFPRLSTGDGIYDDTGEFRNMTWQQIYKILQDIQRKEEEGDYDQDGEADKKGLSKERQKELGEQMSKGEAEEHLVPGDGMSDAEKEELKQDVERMVIKAANDAEMRGKPGSVPGSMRSLIDQIRESKVDWTEFLFTTMQSNFPDDFTYRRPNKKYLDQGMYMPTMESTRVERLVFAFDTSGSVSTDELITFFSEASHLIQQFQPQSVLLMCADYDVAEVIELEFGETIEDGFAFKGGGGTSFVPVFDYIRKNDIHVDQLIYFSDMWVNGGCFPQEHPEFDVIWVSTGCEYDVPFGNLVKVN